MFGQVWGWAGTYRRSDKNLGAPWIEIAVQMRQLVGDAGAWLASEMDADEASVRLGHRLVSVHPFANGNGRHSRLASDCLARALGRETLTWRGGGIGSPGQIRAKYLTALRAADSGDIQPLIAFARSSAVGRARRPAGSVSP